MLSHCLLAQLGRDVRRPMRDCLRNFTARARVTVGEVCPALCFAAVERVDRWRLIARGERRWRR